MDVAAPQPVTNKVYLSKLKDPDTPFTPAHTLIRALRVSLQKLRAEGIENVWKRHARMAAAARAGMQALGMELFAAEPVDGLTVEDIVTSKYLDPSIKL